MSLRVQAIASATRARRERPAQVAPQRALTAARDCSLTSPGRKGVSFVRLENLQILLACWHAKAAPKANIPVVLRRLGAFCAHLGVLPTPRALLNASSALKASTRVKMVLRIVSPALSESMQRKRAGRTPATCALWAHTHLLTAVLMMFSIAKIAPQDMRGCAHCART